VEARDYRWIRRAAGEGWPHKLRVPQKRYGSPMNAIGVDFLKPPRPHYLGWLHHLKHFADLCVRYGGD
jgi:hypothetical protein